MRKLLLTAIVCGLSLASTQSARAQGHNASANASRFGIAVVDISYIFQNYPKFTRTMESMKTEMTTAEDSLKSERDRVQKMEEHRNTLKPGTDDFKRLDEELARQKADFNIKAGAIRRDFLEKEAQVYYQTYLEVSQVVNSFARNNNIGLVLRFNGDQIDPSRREDVLRAINQPIMFQNNIDITPDVLALLSRGGAAVPGGQANRPNNGRPAVKYRRRCAEFGDLPCCGA
ncbi:MAG: OmpH family outer membrane protein [Planctomycetales bacterium]|nr:OmpH family outer membrane protein [Planctomycetales bacterium]